VKCGCGYCFDPNKLDGVTQELEVIAQEEKLYSDYLAARAAQAEEAVQAAKVALQFDPANTVKAAEALLAQQTALSARAEHSSQKTRAHAVKERIKVVRASRRSRRVAKPQTPSRPMPTSMREVVAPPRPTRIAPADIPPIQAPKKAVALKPAAVKATAAPKKQHPVRPKLIAPSAPPPAARPAPVVTVVSQPVVQPKPAPAMITPKPVVYDKPTPAFNATQTTKAGSVIPISARSPAHECPNCTATVRPGAKRCGCGFELTAGDNQIPALSLSPEERAAFMAALAPLKNEGNN
jgi:hypothetical protein